MSATWNKCHLLYLPKELRLEIWKYVLTDPSVPELVARVGRKYPKRFYKIAQASEPSLKFFLRPSRNCRIELNLLLVNRFIYEEALPILYGSVKFAPSDLESVFLVFLQSLSSSVLPLIRHIKLSMPVLPSGYCLFYDMSRLLFHWAVTCAQIAKLNDTLRSVEVFGDFRILEERRKRRAILYPLCKIRATKRWVASGQDADFQRLLAEAEREMKASGKLRKQCTREEAAERVERQARSTPERMQEKQEYTEHDALIAQRPKEEQEQPICVYSLHASPLKGDASVDRDLSMIRGIAQFEKELKEHTEEEIEAESEDWDIVSMRSGMSTPKDRAASPPPEYCDEAWLDTTSTLFGEDSMEDLKVRNGK